MLGVFSTAAHLLFALGCLIAPADRVITLDYTAVLFASALGWLIWSEAPDLWLVLGGALIIGAGISVIRSRPARLPASPSQRVVHPTTLRAKLTAA
jgi:drug/metabolite transporter (DMT)-like permease